MFLFRFRDHSRKSLGLDKLSYLESSSGGQEKFENNNKFLNFGNSSASNNNNNNNDKNNKNDHYQHQLNNKLITHHSENDKEFLQEGESFLNIKVESSPNLLEFHTPVVKNEELNIIEGNHFLLAYNGEGEGPFHLEFFWEVFLFKMGQPKFFCMFSSEFVVLEKF